MSPVVLVVIPAAAEVVRFVFLGTKLSPLYLWTYETYDMGSKVAQLHGVQSTHA